MTQQCTRRVLYLFIKFDLLAAFRKTTASNRQLLRGLYVPIWNSTLRSHVVLKLGSVAVIEGNYNQPLLNSEEQCDSLF